MKNLGLIKKEKDFMQQCVILNSNEKIMLYDEEGRHISSLFGDRNNKVEIHLIYSYTSNRLITIDLYINDKYIGGYSHIKDYNITNWIW